MEIAIIVVIDENNGIGKNNQLLCHLSADLKRFKTLTTGHSIIMGRKTFESLPNGSLPNRKNIVLTKDNGFTAKGIFTVNSVNQVIEMVKEENLVFVIGGEQIYKAFFEIADLLYITKIHHTFEADAFFPIFDLKKWNLIEQIDNLPDEKNNFPYSFLNYIRVS